MVYVIKDTVEKIDMKQHKNTCFLSCLGLFETNQEVPAFCFQNRQNFSNSKLRSPGKESWAKTRPPGQWERTNPRESPRGEWSGLKLTDTLKGKFTQENMLISDVKSDEIGRTPLTVRQYHFWFSRYFHSQLKNMWRPPS